MADAGRGGGPRLPAGRLDHGADHEAVAAPGRRPAKTAPAPGGPDRVFLLGPAAEFGEDDEGDHAGGPGGGLHRTSAPRGRGATWTPVTRY